MEKDKKQFCALWQLDILIDISIQNIVNLLTKYVEFQGLISTEDIELLYVDGIFLAGEYDKRGIEYIEKEFGIDEDITEALIDIVGTKYSNNDSLIGQKLTVKVNNSENKEQYSYDEFIKVTSEIGIPIFELGYPIPPKIFIYKPHQVNQKSNFTVDEASSIASNWVISNDVDTHPKMTIEQSQLRKHNTDILCECIKGHNQQGFHLITKELWIKRVDENYGEYSHQYPNGTQLAVGSNVDLNLTIISKNEFIRWSEFMGIETGLTIDEEVQNESIEYYKIEVEKLNKRVIELTPPPPKFVPCPTAPPVKLKLKSRVEINYPPELQLTIDAYNEFCSLKENRPTNSIIQNWLKQISEDRKIKHNDGARELKGLSQKKLEVITSIIKS